MQHRRTRNRSRTVYPDKEQVEPQRWCCVHSFLGIWNQERITILAIRCFAWNCSLFVWNRRHHDSPRVVQKTVDTRVARETPLFSSSRTGTIRTFVDCTPDGILFWASRLWRAGANFSTGHRLATFRHV